MIQHFSSNVKPRSPIDTQQAKEQPQPKAGGCSECQKKLTDKQKGQENG